MRSSGMDCAPKARPDDYTGRFREIISDPLNTLIPRHPLAGCVDGELVTLHNGLRVPVSGPDAYYGEFSTILILNRGVHEPLEEFVFQKVLTRLPADPVMLELGAYWGHYSMWLKSVRPEATVHLVEPDAGNIAAGRRNFELNGFAATFEQAFVGHGQLEVDSYLERTGLRRLDVLHADIQGHELEMLDGARSALRRKAIDFVFVSTHSQELHERTVEDLERREYRVEVSADFDSGTTSFDGFALASSRSVPPVFERFEPLSRVRILRSTPADLVGYLRDAVKAM